MRALRRTGRRPDRVPAGVADPSPSPGQVIIRVVGAVPCHFGPHLMRDFQAGQLDWGAPAPADGCPLAKSPGVLSSCPRSSMAP